MTRITLCYKGHTRNKLQHISVSCMSSACSCGLEHIYDDSEFVSLRWPTSTILLWYAHCCFAKLFFFPAGYFSSLPNTFRLCRAVFRLCQAFFFYSGWFFGSVRQFSAMLIFSALPTIFLLCWTRLCSVEHFSATLSTFRLYQAFFFYTERFIRSATHFSSMLDICLPYQAFFFYAECFTALPRIFFLSLQYTA